LTLSGEYDGTRNGTFFEQFGTTVGTAKMSSYYVATCRPPDGYRQHLVEVGSPNQT
jgi:hypothetical protein